MAKKTVRMDYLTKKYLLMTQLSAITAKFALAMERAHVPYIAKQGRFTLSMEMAWAEYVEWAKRAAEAGL